MQCNDVGSARGQEKHSFAVERQGPCSLSRCEESPRAYGQRVPAEDRYAPPWLEWRGFKLSHAGRLGKLQQQRHAVSACLRRQLNGLALFMLSLTGQNLSTGKKAFYETRILKAQLWNDPWT
eukprot:TRINITY_DN12299_c0_g1_i3.p1 TRINITY_DN12299_c0_g1~~TRINITY_DN12299_c0_g1_i3.p1  ORF type:complete len:122 (-),score=24.30 TRINITY_DN12299_c0_g1_i3:114-479(-)